MKYVLILALLFAITACKKDRCTKQQKPDINHQIKPSHKDSIDKRLNP